MRDNQSANFPRPLRRIPRGKANHARHSGFTLLELVVAMGIVVFLVGSLYASLQIAFKAKASSDRAVEPARTGELALELIGQDIQNAMAPGELPGNFVGTQATDNRGNEADDLNFYTTADSPQHVSANGEVKNVELTVIQPQNSSDHVLIRRVTRNLLPLTTVTPDVEVICRHVSSFSLQYYDGSQVPLLSWDSTQEDNTIPVAVRVTLEIERPDPGSNSGLRTYQYSRVFPLSCSTAAFDAQVNPTATSAQ